ncbi:hypothetical protein BDR06DRAFT_967885 [Suillus hirtellus]|nr:hypothetical protein BDR06DRAFT_967885 [Suillus hirtellus]
MKDQSTVKAANISARPSLMGTCQPLPRPLRSGSHFFPPNVLDDKGDSMKSLFLPPTPSPNPRLPPHLLNHDATEVSVPISPIPTPPPVAAGETSPDEETTVEDLSNSIHAPRPDEDAVMSDNSPPTYSYPSPSKLAAPTEEDLLRTHLAVEETNRAIVKPSGTNSLTMIPQFTPILAGGFPKIHLAHAAQLFDFQAPKVITAWLKVPHSKILIRVFDHDGKNPSIKGPILVERLCKAIMDIAQFMHQDGKEIKRIWSSLDITFAAHQFSVNTPPLPLFCLHSFSTLDTATVKNAVLETWSDEFTSWEIMKILAESDIPAEEVHTAMREFIKTLWVEHLDFKDRKAMVALKASAKSGDLFRSRMSKVTERLPQKAHACIHRGCLGYDNPLFPMVIPEDVVISTIPSSLNSNVPPQTGSIPGPSTFLPSSREGGL